LPLTPSTDWAQRSSPVAGSKASKPWPELRSLSTTTNVASDHELGGEIAVTQLNRPAVVAAVQLERLKRKGPLSSVTETTVAASSATATLAWMSPAAAAHATAPFASMLQRLSTDGPGIEVADPFAVDDGPSSPHALTIITRIAATAHGAITTTTPRPDRARTCAPSCQ
jgi:hypothetical protein